MSSYFFHFVFNTLLAIYLTALNAASNDKFLDQKYIIRNSTDIAFIFPKTAAELDSNFQIVKNNVLAELQQIVSISPADRTFENTVLAYDRTMAYFRIQGSVLATLKMVHPDINMSKKAEEILKNWWDCQIDLFETNKDIYRSLKEYKATSTELLNEERQYYFSNVMQGFAETGLELTSQDYLELKKLQKQIASLSIQFYTNIAQHASPLQFKSEELLGIEDDFINSLPKIGDKYKLDCDYPTYTQVMANCSIESTRKNYILAFNNRAFPKNLEILAQIIDSRDQLAQLLGYKSYAEYDIAPQMAQSVENVEKFLDDLSFKAYPKIKSNWDMLKSELPESVSLTAELKIKPWDVAYLTNQYLKKYFNIDRDQIAEYFPMETTIRGLLDVYEKFFNLKFQVVTGSAFWDSSVQMIEVRYGGTNQSVIGYVLLDLFPRENKYSHCCCNCIVPPMSFDKGQTFAPALAVVIANFSKSTSEKPSLLKHSEVKTFFHEFGHAIHAIFGKAEMPTTAAYNTKMDFIEAPSQLLEEWMWDPEILKKVSRHYQTGAPLSDSIIEKLIKTRGFIDAAHFTTGGSSDHVGTELFFAKLSLQVFKEGKNKNLIQIDKDVYDSTPQIVAYHPELHHICAFEHLIGYGAKYYSYPWSKELSLKIFNYIKSHGGLLDPIMGERYISKIIGKGGSCDPNLLLIDFLGTETN